MATCSDVDRVQYLAASGVKAPLCRLYFCRHCLKLRSSDCVSHEVDSHFCPNCLENMPSAEAKLKKNRCLNCFNCPSCCHTVSVRAVNAAVPDPNDPNKTTPRKAFYLACAFCKWTSRDVGMKDQLVSSGGWPEQENPHAQRISTLLEHYRQLAQREKAEKEKKKYIRRRSYLHYSDKFGLGSVAARRRSGLMGMGGLSLKDDDMKVQEVEPSVASAEVELLPEDVFTQPLVLTQVTSLFHRHAAPETQPDSSCALYPRHQHLLIKKSQRCRECEHNLSKPEFNPSSIKFKIQLVALHHVPEVRILSLPNLLPNKESQVILTTFNPLDSVCHVTLLPNEREGDTWANSKAILPKGEILLGPRDDAAQFDDTSDQHQDYKDDPSVIVFRKANKLGFFIKVLPGQLSEDVKISFVMKYDYRNIVTVLHSEGKEPERVWLEHPVYLNMGPLSTPAK